ncbi:MAG: DNA cytosine methyltransferase [Gammaproteobacteria bacterium]|nr:DNA cytosine methyltransferase [Gammaproteobacteria bacterium]
MCLDNELVIDNFAGGGGASAGIEAALNRPVNIAINHDPEAVALHKINHPHTHHYCEDVFSINQRELVKGRPVGLVWLSPDCTHHSRAKGGRPVKKNIRGLAWVALRWATLPAPSKPRVIMLENVEEFKGWGPLVNGRPCKERKGKTFNQFCDALRAQGYVVEYRSLTASDYGAPTRRTRLFLIARSDGQPIVWPNPTHGKKGSGLLPEKIAGDCIDWSVPGQSIFGRKRPLVEKTMIRIARGMQKFIIDDDNPYIVPHQGHHTASFINEHANSSSQRIIDIQKPLPTICAQVKGGHFSLVSAYLIRYFGNGFANSIKQPIPTIMAGGGGKSALVTAFLVKYYGADKHGQALNVPLDTITTNDRFGLVTVKGIDYQIVDITLRMLLSRELYTAQGFTKDYKIDFEYNGRPLSKTSKVRMCGNSVSPYMSYVLTDANFMQSSLFVDQRFRRVS